MLPSEDRCWTPVPAHLSVCSGAGPEDREGSVRTADLLLLQYPHYLPSLESRIQPLRETQEPRLPTPPHSAPFLATLGFRGSPDSLWNLEATGGRRVRASPGDSRWRLELLSWPGC